MPQDRRMVATWNDNILPTDDQAEHMADLADINNDPPLMTLEDFLRRWRDGVDTPEDAKKYLESIRVEQEATKPEPAPNPLESVLTNGGPF
jgi:hypothetical protein